MTGAQLWNCSTGVGGWGTYCAPGVANGIVYVTFYATLNSVPNFFAFNATTGNELWNYTTGGNNYGSPTVSNGIVYFGSWDKNLYALNATTGLSLWNFTTGGSIDSTPAVFAGVVYFGSWDGNIYAVNAATGASVWNYSLPTGQGYGTWCSPVIAGNVLYLGFNGYYSYRLEAINVTSGLELWHLNAGYQLFSSTPVVNGILYIVYGGQVLAYVSPNVPVANLSPTSWTMDIGQSKSFTATATGGSGTYTSYTWYVDSASQGSTASASFSYTPSTTGSHSIAVTVTDNTGTTSSQSTPASVTVNTSPTVSVAPVGPFTMDVGQSQLFTATPSGGSGTYTSYQWYVNGQLAQSGAASTMTWGSPNAGTFSITVKVTDSLSATSVPSNAASVTVDSAPSISVQPSAAIDSGQSISSTVTGGTGSFSWQWYDSSNPSGISGASGTGTTATYAPAASDTGIYVVFTDTGTGSATPAATATSSSVAVTVNPALAAPTVTPTPGTVDQGQTSSLTSTAVSTGTSPYTYQWFEKAPGGSYVDVGTNSASFSFVTSGSTATGVWSFELQVTDSATTAVVVTSAAASVTVNVAAPTVTVSPGTATLNVGQSQLFTATPSGGSGSYTSYQWYVNGVAQSGQTASTFSYSPASAGSYSITATVTDSSGATSAQSTAAAVTASATVTSTPVPTAAPTPVPTAKPTPVPTAKPTPVPTASPTPTPTLTPAATAAAFVFGPVDWVIVVIVIIIVLILIILAWYRRHRNLTVTVQNSQTNSPISGATVSATGPKTLTGTTGSQGQIIFSNVQKGDYTIKANATGYNTSIPASVPVKNNTNYIIKLDSTAPKTPETKTK
jgi:outer membrane protein assembly factor BamB